MSTNLSSRPATQRLYVELKRWALSLSAGRRIGSEAEVLVALSASRPTLRNAASLLENEQLLKIRRGNGGGYYAIRPTAEVAMRVFANYLESLALPHAEVLAAWAPVRSETVCVAARNRGGAARAQLEAFVAELRRGQDRHFSQCVRRFNALLALMADNRLLALFYELMYQSSGRSDQQDFYRCHPERVPLYRKQMLSVAQAILAGDESKAVQASDRCNELNLRWVAEDPGSGFVPPPAAVRPAWYR